MDRKIHKNRNDLIGEHKIGDAGQLIFAVLFLFIWVADSFFFEFSTFLNEIIPNAIRTTAGLIVLIIAGYLAMAGMKVVFGEVRDKPQVIRKGIFGLIRHPVYMGEVLTYLGFLLLSLSIISAVVWLLIIVFLYNISRYEEKLLVDFFGEEYRQYMNEVPMWIPKLSSLFSKRNHS